MPLTKFVAAPLSLAPKSPTTSSSQIDWFQSCVPTRPNLKASNFTTGKVLTSHRLSLRSSPPRTTVIFFRTRELTSDLKTRVSLFNSFSTQRTHIFCQATWTFFSGPSRWWLNVYSTSWTNCFSQHKQLSSSTTWRSRSTTSLYRSSL